MEPTNDGRDVGGLWHAERMRLESLSCAIAYCTPRNSDSDFVVATAEKFLRFLQLAQTDEVPNRVPDEF